MLNFAPAYRTNLTSRKSMRKLLLALAVICAIAPVLSACGYRTPLTLPKPEAKPPATLPAAAPAAIETK